MIMVNHKYPMVNDGYYSGYYGRYMVNDGYYMVNIISLGKLKNNSLT